MASIMQGTTPTLTITINKEVNVTFPNVDAAIDALIEYAKSEVIK